MRSLPMMLASLVAGAPAACLEAPPIDLGARAAGATTAATNPDGRGDDTPSSSLDPLDPVAPRDGR